MKSKSYLLLGGNSFGDEEEKILEEYKIGNKKISGYENSVWKTHEMNCYYIEDSIIIFHDRTFCIESLEILGETNKKINKVKSLLEKKLGYKKKLDENEGPGESTEAY